MRINDQNLWDIGFATVRELETDQGILASGKNELYGCIFGRDSLITSLKLLQVYKQTKNEDSLRIVKKALQTLASLQGKEINIESGEEPGKMIHEFRPDNHEHLTKGLQNPWYVYPDQVMRNYDTIDATPLFLIAAYRYHQLSGDDEFLQAVLPNIKKALEWILEFADTNHDGFLDYQLNPDRKAGGLTNQNWMDSTESTFHEDGTVVKYPLAPVEAQGYAYLALRLWANGLANTDPKLADTVYARAVQLKKLFNKTFVILDTPIPYLGSALDGNGKLLKSKRSNMGHCLWASLTREADGELDGIVDEQFVPGIVQTLMAKDMFEPQAGIRTLSTASRNFQANSYHNGSIWPHDNSMVAQGMENYGYTWQAKRVRKAVLQAIAHFNTPIELYVYWNGQYSDYTSLTGQTACKKQAWSAASILADTISLYPKRKSVRETIEAASTMLMLIHEMPAGKLNNVFKTSLMHLTNSVPIKPIRKGFILPKQLAGRRQLEMQNTQSDNTEQN